MAGFILCRKSRDEDAEHESLHMQRDLVREYVHKVGDTIVDEVLEDNISGTLFDRPGIKRMYELADAKMIDTVYIKDLSRLSRDRFYTLLIVKDMKERNVRIVSVTEGIDSFNKSDDLIIGFKGLINDSYVQDLIVKILSALRHKQQFEGIVINRDTYEVYLDGNRLDFPPKEFELLFFLAGNKNKVFVCIIPADLLTEAANNAIDFFFGNKHVFNK